MTDARGKVLRVDDTVHKVVHVRTMGPKHAPNRSHIPALKRYTVRGFYDHDRAQLRDHDNIGTPATELVKE